MTSTVRIGTTFSSVFADGNYTWKVVKRIGGNPLSWLCEIVDEGTQKAFLDSEIRSKISQRKNIERYLAERETWWDDQKIGTVLHYNNGFGDWIRGEVVDVDGKKVMKPTALVGKWRESEYRPKYRADGELDVPYHVRSIRDSEGWRPDTGCVWEASDHQRKQYEDPTTMAPLDISIPELPKEQKEEAALWQKVNQVRDLLNLTNDAMKHDGKTPKQLLSEIRGIVGRGPQRLFDF
jgi:hypothetical protein